MDQRSKVRGQAPRRYKFALESENGVVHLSFNQNRLRIVEEAGGFFIVGARNLGPHSLGDLFREISLASLGAGLGTGRFGLDNWPTVSTGRSRFKLRKNFLDLTEFEKDRFADALNWAYGTGLIGQLAAGHHNHWRRKHFVPQFLPWHRMLLRNLEHRLQQFDPEVTLPYWDWTDSRAQSFDTEMLGQFFGGREGDSGPFAHWAMNRETGSVPNLMKPTVERVVAILRRGSFSSMRSFETAPEHTWAHTWIGGDMSTTLSPRDPLFYLHHCMVDRVWALWQLNHAQAPQYDTARIFGDMLENPIVEINDPMDSGGMGISFSPQSFLDHRRWDYAYPEDPRLRDAFEGPGNLITGDPLEFVVAPNSWEFGEIRVGKYAYMQFTMENALDREIDIFIESSDMSGGSDGAFTWDGLEAKFSPGEVRTHSVRFAPGGAGPFEAELRVVADLGPGLSSATAIKRRLYGVGVS